MIHIRCMTFVRRYWTSRIYRLIDWLIDWLENSWFKACSDWMHVFADLPVSCWCQYHCGTCAHYKCMCNTNDVMKYCTPAALLLLFMYVSENDVEQQTFLSRRCSWQREAPLLVEAVYLCICLSVAKLRTKSDFLEKSKQFRATVSIDDL